MGNVCVYTYIYKYTYILKYLKISSFNYDGNLKGMEKKEVLGKYEFFSISIVSYICLDDKSGFIKYSHFFFSLKLSLLIYFDFEFDMSQVYFNILLEECY